MCYFNWFSMTDWLFSAFSNSFHAGRPVISWKQLLLWSVLWSVLYSDITCNLAHILTAYNLQTSTQIRSSSSASHSLPLRLLLTPLTHWTLMSFTRGTGQNLPAIWKLFSTWCFHLLLVFSSNCFCHVDPNNYKSICCATAQCYQPCGLGFCQHIC